MALPDFRTTSRNRPWHHVGYRILRPFSGPEGQQWCRPCQAFTDVQHEGRFEGTVYADKTWCRRCGGVTAYGVYNQHHDPAVGRRAREWAMAREEPACRSTVLT